MFFSIYDPVGTASLEIERVVVRKPDCETKAIEIADDTFHSKRRLLESNQIMSATLHNGESIIKRYPVSNRDGELK